MTLLQEVYSTWVANGRCSSYQLANAMNKKGYNWTESTAHQRLNQAIVANCSGMLYPGTKPTAPAHMQNKPLEEGRGR